MHSYIDPHTLQNESLSAEALLSLFPSITKTGNYKGRDIRRALTFAPNAYIDYGQERKEKRESAQ